ncbi:MAG: hypothetical protein IJ867_01195 [Clostridia bacterium]|nr:hypothetical protein [Clostridia bacterium]
MHGGTRVVVAFGEDAGTGDVPEAINPMIEGLTTGTSLYDGVFVLRNPENCNIVNYALKDIPVYLSKKLRNMYDICMDFYELPKRKNIAELISGESIKIRNLEITSYIVDPSNFNTSILSFKDGQGKTLVVCGDFKNYDGSFGQERLSNAISLIRSADILVIEGKYFGKFGLEYSSGKDVLEKLKNIMKFYKQIFVIQSETDLVMTSNLYQAASKSKKAFIESTFVANLATTAGGSCPTPFTDKKVYTYNPLVLENREFDFKKKYIAPFYISNGINRMKRERYVMNVTKEFLQDIQVFEKEGTFYDACVILSQWKASVQEDKELEDFINEMKNFDMDYYEIYTHGQVNMNTLKWIINRLHPSYVIPLDFSNEKGVENELYNFKVLKENEVIDA